MMKDETPKRNSMSIQLAVWQVEFVVDLRRRKPAKDRLDLS